jgi:hypothetical protein
VIVRVVVESDGCEDSVVEIFEVMPHYPGPDEIEIVVLDVGPDGFKRCPVRTCRVDAADPNFLACLAEFGHVAVSSTRDREAA